MGKEKPQNQGQGNTITMRQDKWDRKTNLRTGRNEGKTIKKKGME